MKLKKKPTYQDLENQINQLKLKNKLKQSGNLFNKLLKASEDMITINEPNGKFLYYNGPESYAINPEDIVGKMPNDLFNEDVSNKLMLAFKEVKKTGESQTVEVLLDWLGEKRWFLEYIYPVKNADGEVVEMVKVCRDIHKRKIAEQEVENQNKALLESAKSHREVLKASSDLISVVDKNGKILFVNHASKKIYGLSPKKCLGRSIFDFTHPEDKEDTETKFVEWENSEKNHFHIENRQINISGKILETEWHINVERVGKEIIKITSIIRDITKQNIIYRKLRKANKEREQFFNFFELSPDVMVIANQNGVFRSVNPATTKLLGYSEEVLTSKPFIDFVHPDDKQITLNEFEKGIKEGKTSINFENRYLCENNEYLFLSWRAYFNKKEGVTYATAVDITNEKLIELELIKSKEHAEESEERFRTLMLNMETGIIVHAPDTSILLSNIRATEILGLSYEQLKGKKAIDPDWKFVKSDKTPLPFKEYPVNLILNSKKPLKDHVLGIFQTDKTDIIWVTVNGYPVLNNTGEIIEVVISFINITEKKLIEEEKISAILKLESSDKRLNQTQRLAQVGSWFIDLPSQKVEWSDEAYKIWGFDSNNGTPDYDSIIKMVHTDDLELFNSSYEKAVNLCIAYDIEFRIHLSNDEQKTVRAICQPILGENGKVVSITGANQDITSQKTFEKAQIKHQRIKAIGEMSSSIAHDFNNSLQQMMGNLEVIKLQNDYPENTLERLNCIGSIIGDVADRVSALQKFGDTEHDDKDTKLIDFNTLIEESLLQSRPLWKDDMEKKGLKINVITDLKDIPKITGNNGELKSAVYNLIKNSVEAMPEGGDIIIKTGEKDEGIFATFTDTGIGMNEETKRKVFEPFFSTKGFKLGRGLGMSGVFNIIKKSIGNIAVKSAGLSKGSTFEIVFPVGKQENIKVIDESKGKNKEKFNVLWVDDDISITEDVSELLELMGHKCTIANSGKSALEYLNKNTCDIVFTDIGMSGMNGWELIAAIRNNFGNKIKIITVSGWNIDEKAKEEHTIDFVLQKPFTIDRLEKLFLEL